jgi:putative peptidoglycan lipid II flippase
MSFGNGVLSSYNYSQALYQIPQMIVTTGVLAIVSTNFMNKIHENEIDDGLNKLYDIAINSFIVAMFAAITISIFSKEIVYILFFRGNFTYESINQTSDILYLLIFALPFLVVGSILGRVLVVLKKIRIQTWINVFTAITSILFLFISFLSKNKTLGIISVILVHSIIVIYKLIIYKNFYIEICNKKSFINKSFYKKLLLMFIYTLALLFLKNLFQINIGLNKLNVLKELMLVFLLFSLSLIIYYNFVKKELKTDLYY